MSATKEELESMIRRILSESLRDHKPEEGHVHAPIDKHLAECVDCNKKNDAFRPDGKCSDCGEPVYWSDPICPHCREGKTLVPWEDGEFQKRYGSRLK